MLVFTVAAGYASIHSAWLKKETPLSPEELAAEARSSFNENDFRKAADLYKRALIIDPANSRYWLQKGYAHLAEHHGRRMWPAPDQCLIEFETHQPTKVDELNSAYSSFNQALKRAISPFELAEAHTALGLTTLSMGCECFYNSSSLFRNSGVIPCCGGALHPVHHFFNAVKEIRNIENPLTLARHNQRMFLSGFAWDGFTRTVLKSPSGKWDKYIEELALSENEPIEALLSRMESNSHHIDSCGVRETNTISSY
jgi:tetratricopeptide (TPR) repeat protein